MTQLKKETGKEGKLMIMSIIDIHDGRTALDRELEDIGHGDSHDHVCGGDEHVVLGENIK